MYLDLGSTFINLPASSCGIVVPAGTVTLHLSLPNHKAGRRVQATVSGAVGEWDDERFQGTLKVEQNKTSTFTFDLQTTRQPAPITYTITGGPPLDSSLASAPDRKGPWTPVADSGLVPPDAAWLRVTYPSAMTPDALSLLTRERDEYPGRGLPGEWDGNQTQYLALGGLPPILWVRGAADSNGLSIGITSPPTLYLGEPPTLKAVNPADGAARTVHRFSDVPEFIDLWQGNVRYGVSIPSKVGFSRTDYRRIDVTTGQVSPAPEREQRTLESRLRFPSPDGKLMAEIVFPNGKPDHVIEHKQYFADLVIREQSSGNTVFKQQRWLSSWGAYGSDKGCSQSAPGFGWRADSAAVAVVDAPDPDHLILKETDLHGATRVIMQKASPNVGHDQYVFELLWSPSGTMIKYGEQVVDTTSGRVVSDKLPRYGIWSPDSQYLLVSEHDHFATSWGMLSLVQVVTGKRQELGRGQAVGWNSKGEALMVRWDASRQLPGPQKGCQ